MRPLRLMVLLALACEHLMPGASLDIQQKALSWLAQALPAINDLAEVATPLGDISLKSHFDFVIVGAGPAGCALAVELLSRNSSWSVLLLEAGDFPTAIMDIPLLALSLIEFDANWGYSTVPQNTSCVGLEGSRCPYVLGRAVGGGTAINHFFVVRGGKEDYDAWEQLGNTGWGYEDFLPYFKQMEKLEIPELQNSSYRGYKGPVSVTYPPYRTNMSNLLVRMAKERGIYNEDPNAESIYGLSRIQSTTKDGKRVSAYSSYLKPAMKAYSNLYVRKLSFVHQVLFEGDRAVGVRYRRKGIPIDCKVYASKEVIIAGGTVHSPALLIRSGVGPSDHLKELGIPVVKDLPVGHNLQDHAGFPWLLCTMNESMAPLISDILSNISNFNVYLKEKQGPFTMLGTLETMIFAKIEDEPIEMLISSMSPVFDEKSVEARGISSETYNTVIAPLGRTPVFQVTLWPSQPYSRGRVYLQSGNPDDDPLIDPQALSDVRDRKLTIKAIRLWERLMEEPALRGVNAKLWSVPLTGCEQLEFDSDDYWECAITRFGQTLYHPCCTNKMGRESDSEAVVGLDLKVRGLNDLRVCDSSVMPKITSGHLQIPSYAIGLKCGDIIAKEHGS